MLVPAKNRRAISEADSKSWWMMARKTKAAIERGIKLGSMLRLDRLTRARKNFKDKR